MVGVERHGRAPGGPALVPMTPAAPSTTDTSSPSARSRPRDRVGAPCQGLLVESSPRDAGNRGQRLEVGPGRGMGATRALSASTTAGARRSSVTVATIPLSAGLPGGPPVGPAGALQCARVPDGRRPSAQPGPRGPARAKNRPTPSGATRRRQPAPRRHRPEGGEGRNRVARQQAAAQQRQAMLTGDERSTCRPGTGPGPPVHPRLCRRPPERW